MKVMTTNKGIEFIVDDDVYELIKDRTWRQGTHGYVYKEKTVKGRKIKEYLHKMLCPTEKGFLVDHRDGNILNNCRDNLRPATHYQNSANRKSLLGSSSQYLGVYKDIRKYGDKIYTYWTAKVKQHGKVLYKTTFKDEVEAAKAYDKAAKEIHGEFARLNFPTV